MSQNINKKTKAWIEAQGLRAEKVEWFDKRTRRSHDLFGFIDFLGIGEGRTLGVQATNYANVSNRVKKCKESDAFSDVLAAGWDLVVIGFKPESQEPDRIVELV